MSLLLVFARAYPWQSLIMLACLLLATVAEGIGLSSLLPLLSLAAQAGTGVRTGPDSPVGKGGLAHVAGDLLLSVGLQPSIGLLLMLIMGRMALKAGFVLLAQKQIGDTVAQVATDLRLALIRALLAARWEYYVRQPDGVKPLKAMAHESLIGPLLEGETQRLNRAFQREVLSKGTLRAARAAGGRVAGRWSLYRVDPLGIAARQPHPTGCVIWQSAE